MYEILIHFSSQSLKMNKYNLFNLIILHFYDILSVFPK